MIIGNIEIPSRGNERNRIGDASGYALEPKPTVKRKGRRKPSPRRIRRHTSVANQVCRQGTGRKRVKKESATVKPRSSVVDGKNMGVTEEITVTSWNVRSLRSRKYLKMILIHINQ